MLDIYEQKKLVEHVKEVSQYLEEKLDSLVTKYTGIKERRGKGLMQGLELDHPANKYIIKAQELGLIIVTAGANVIRFLPPLVIEKEHVDEMIGILESCLTEVE